VFTLNLRESLLSYQEYFETLQKEKEELKKKVKTSMGQKLLQAKQEGNHEEQASLESQLELNLKDIDRKFSGAIDQLV